MDEKPEPPGVIEAERWLDKHGDFLFRLALSRVRSPETAEDLVQETLLAAMRASGSYAMRSSERSWLAGILKHKIVDHFRVRSRETAFTDLDFLSDELPHKFEGEFWNHDLGPEKWRGAVEALDREDFWKVFRGCMDKLPEGIAGAFSLREMDGLPSKEVCATLGITENNLWVMLHRARMALRECLEINWFRGTGPKNKL